MHLTGGLTARTSRVDKTSRTLAGDRLEQDTATAVVGADKENFHAGPADCRDNANAAHDDLKAGDWPAAE